MNRLLGIIFFVLLIPFFSNAQSKADKKYEKELYQKANEHMYNENYPEAQRTYLKLLEIVPNNDLYLLETGLSFFFAASERDEALSYFEQAKADSRPDTLIELYYYLGRAYQLNSKFEDAVVNYEKFKGYLKDNKTGRQMSEEIEGYIRMCQHGQYHLNLFAQNPVANADAPIKDLTKYFITETDYIAIENLGKKLNSQYSDYTPLLLNKKNNIVFTSRRNRIDDSDSPLFDGQFYEKVYISRFADGEWKQPVEINYSSLFGASFQNLPDKHISVIYINQDENILLSYSDNKISQLRRTGTKWSSSEEFPEVINNPDALQSSAAISNDGQTLYVVSEKKKGYGGRDIYVSQKQPDGTWGELENIGASINTEKDEEAPYITKDNQKLYFASQGHSSIGGYDIFVSEKDKKGKWTTAQSLGVPINTPADEIYYIPKDEGDVAYYSSSRPGGYGDLDLYLIYKGVEPIKKDTLPAIAAAEEEKEENVEEEIAMVEEAEPEEVTEEEPEEVLEEAPEEIAEEVAEEISEEVKEIVKEVVEEVAEANEQKEEVAITETTEEVEVEEVTKVKQEVAEVVKEEKTKLPQTKPTASSKPEVKSLPAEVLANLDFGFNSNQLSDENKAQLKKLAEEIQNNENTVLTLNGHADYIGTNEVNMQVSKQRALVVYKYLVEEGTSPNQLRLGYFGEEKPLVPGQTEDGKDIPENRAKNRRVDFEVKEYKLYRFVLYGFDSYALNNTSNATLDEVVKYLKANPGSKAQLNGHTDKQGNVDYNKYLSKKRVESVFNYLVEAGVEKNRLVQNAYGVENPAVPDGAGINQKYNRRVEIHIN